LPSYDRLKSPIKKYLKELSLLFVYKKLCDIMAKDYKKIIGQMIDIAKDGNLGIEIEKTQKEYEKIDDNIACIIKYIYDVLTPKSENDLEITKSKAIFAQYIIVAYRESKKNDSEIAEALLLKTSLQFQILVY
jgi:hypothetical protein